MFNGDTLRDAMISAANNLTNNRKQIDELNVFPVPDGDTGTNMSMTLANSARELEKLSGATAGQVAKVNSSALLRGARGNSGVITSLLFRGFSKGIGDSEYMTAENISAAFSLGVEAAYKAVMKPTCRWCTGAYKMRCIRLNRRWMIYCKTSRTAWLPGC